MRLLYTAAILSFVLDQLTKWLVVHHLDLKNVLRLDVLPPLLNFRMGWNTGINFGLFSDSPEVMRYVLIALAILVSIGIVWWARGHLSRVVTLTGAGFVIGGALGNALDRVVYGAVADFLNVACCGINNPFTFNVADIFIFAGAIILVAFDDDRLPNKTT